MLIASSLLGVASEGSEATPSPKEPRIPLDTTALPAVRAYIEEAGDRGRTGREVARLYRLEDVQGLRLAHRAVKEAPDEFFSGYRQIKDGRGPVSMETVYYCRHTAIRTADGVCSRDSCKRAN